MISECHGCEEEPISASLFVQLLALLFVRQEHACLLTVTIHLLVAPLFVALKQPFAQIYSSLMILSDAETVQEHALSQGSHTFLLGDQVH